MRKCGIAKNAAVITFSKWGMGAFGCIGAINSLEPKIAGELSEKIDIERLGRGVRLAQMNENFHEIVKVLPKCALVSSEGLTLKDDNLHFNSASLREFGLRYAKAYKGLSIIGK